MPDPADLRPLTGLAVWARRLLWLQAAICALSIGLALLNGPVPYGADGDLAYGLLGLVQFLGFLAAGVVVLFWIHRATTNVLAMGAQGLPTGPRLAVASYFIPIANLILPYQSMRDIVKASTEPRDWEIVATPAVLGWWWAFWLLSGFTGTAALRFSFDPAFTEDASISHALTLASDLLTIPAALLLTRIIDRVTALQTSP